MPPSFPHFPDCTPEIFSHSSLLATLCRSKMADDECSKTLTLTLPLPLRQPPSPAYYPHYCAASTPQVYSICFSYFHLGLKSKRRKIHYITLISTEEHLEGKNVFWDSKMRRSAWFTVQIEEKKKTQYINVVENEEISEETDVKPSVTENVVCGFEEKKTFQINLFLNEETLEEKHGLPSNVL